MEFQVGACVYMSDDAARSHLVIDGNSEAKRLYEELIKVRSYNKLIRPVRNNSEKLTVYLGLRLTQLLDVVRSTLSR